MVCGIQQDERRQTGERIFIFFDPTSFMSSDEGTSANTHTANLNNKGEGKNRKLEVFYTVVVERVMS